MSLYFAASFLELFFTIILIILSIIISINFFSRLLLSSVLVFDSHAFSYTLHKASIQFIEAFSCYYFGCWVPYPSTTADTQTSTP